MNGELTVPGKIFLIGEYSVLAGEPALLAAIKLFSNEPKLGFGSSTAKWVMDNANSTMPLGTKDLWNAYAHAHSRGSGADLVAQNEAFLGNGSIFEIRTSRELGSVKVSAVTLDAPQMDAIRFVHVFSAALDLSRKMFTDGALKNISGDLEYPKTESYIEQWKKARSPYDFEFLNLWVQEFVKLGLETGIARADREHIQGFKGVTAVKGCGAGLNDVFLVVIDPAVLSREDMVKTIAQIEKDRNLKYLGTLDERLWKL